MTIYRGYLWRDFLGEGCAGEVNGGRNRHGGSFGEAKSKVLVMTHDDVAVK